MMHCKRKVSVHGFNMIEVVLALGLVAVGVVSIMGLFPVGMNATRDAMAEGYAVSAADQLLHQLQYAIRQPGPPTGWDVCITGTTSPPAKIPSAKPSTANFAISGGYMVPNTGGTLYQTAALASDGIYKVLRYVDKAGGTAGQYDAGIDVLDFEAIMVVWQSAVSIPTSGGSTGALSNNIARALNVEVSWPAQLDSSQRQTSEFRIELFNR